MVMSKSEWIKPHFDIDEEKKDDDLSNTAFISKNKNHNKRVYPIEVSLARFLLIL